MYKKYKNNLELNSEDISRFNKEVLSKQVVIQFDNTKGINKELIGKLNNDVLISIPSGYSGKRKYKLSKYTDRTFYSTRELYSILEQFEKVERKINPIWNDLQKALFVYNILVNYLDYSSSEEKNYKENCNLNSLKGILPTKRTIEASGAALIFKEMMDRLDVTCYLQTNNITGWNVFRIKNLFLGIDLYSEIKNKKSGKNQFKFFGSELGNKFYTGDRDISRIVDEIEYYLNSISKEEIERNVKILNSDTLEIKKTNSKTTSFVNDKYSVYSNENKIRFFKSIDNDTTREEDSNHVFTREDGSQFVLVPIEKDNLDNLYQYLYIDKYSEDSFRGAKLTSEMDIDSIIVKEPSMKADIANSLLNPNRVNDKIYKFNGYVGYLENGEKKTNIKFEQNKLNVFRM